jgi:hypothetical protein
MRNWNHASKADWVGVVRQAGRRVKVERKKKKKSKIQKRRKWAALGRFVKWWLRAVQQRAGRGERESGVGTGVAVYETTTFGWWST